MIMAFQLLQIYYKNLFSARLGFALCRTYSSKKGAFLPDYNTDPNVHKHRLKRPDKPPPSWVGLQGLKERTKGSLIPDTIKEMDQDDTFRKTLENLKKQGQKKLTRDERKRRQRALDDLNVPNFAQFWNEKKKEEGIQDKNSEILKKRIDTLQLNIGLYCNQACNHCHVESSPRRKEMMNREVADQCLKVLENSPNIKVVDITGGAPELCDNFRYLVTNIRSMKRDFIDVIDRCNLTALQEPGQEDLADFLATHQVRVIASLPCYSAKNVNMQRGKGVFDRSIQALLTLNSLGYGQEGSGLFLDLVYNPLGAYLPPKQDELQLAYRKELLETFGIEFNQIFTMTNMPIKRFADFLYNRNELADYMELLVRNYNIATIDHLMCRNHLNVSWNGIVYDCDFNQQLSIGMSKGEKNDISIFDIKSTQELENIPAITDNHCFGCSAGMGSS